MEKRFKAFVAKVWKSLQEVDLTDKSNKILLRIVICNFAVLFLVCLFWDYRMQALVIYSVILFFILRKYYKDIKRKYARLLEATGELAKGNMNVEIKENLGMFNPFKPEIEKIQEGYKKCSGRGNKKPAYEDRTHYKCVPRSENATDSNHYLC